MRNRQLITEAQITTAKKKLNEGQSKRSVVKSIGISEFRLRKRLKLASKNISSVNKYFLSNL